MSRGTHGHAWLLQTSKTPCSLAAGSKGSFRKRKMINYWTSCHSCTSYIVMSWGMCKSGCHFLHKERLLDQSCTPMLHRSMHREGSCACAHVETGFENLRSDCSASRLQGQTCACGASVCWRWIACAPGSLPDATRPEPAKDGPIDSLHREQCFGDQHQVPACRTAMQLMQSPCGDGFSTDG